MSISFGYTIATNILISLIISNDSSLNDLYIMSYNNEFQWTQTYYSYNISIYNTTV